MATEAVQKVVDYTLKVMALVGGSGGIVYWFDRFHNRPRLKVKLQREYFLLPEAARSPRVVFEVVNVGNGATSIDRILLTGYTPKGRRRTFEFEMNPSDRHLAPHTPVMAAAVITGDTPAELVFLWFKTYSIRTTRGRAGRLRMRSIDGVQLGRARFLLELFWFRLTGRTPWARVNLHLEE